jgi:hypothetical protein
MKDMSGTVRLPTQAESIAPVAILDGQGTVVRVLPAEEFRRLHPIGFDLGHALGQVGASGVGSSRQARPTPTGPEGRLGRLSAHEVPWSRRH